MRETGFSPHGQFFVEHLQCAAKKDMSVQHYHDSYEIYLQLSGKRYVFWDNICYTMEPGDLMVFKPFDLHYAKSREVDYFERYVLNFQKEIFNGILSRDECEILLNKIDSCVIRLKAEQVRALKEDFVRVDQYKGQNGFLAKKILYSAVLQLVMHMIQCTDKSESVDRVKIAPQIVEALRYTDKHYRENLTLDEIAEMVHVSKYHFCRMFRAATGASYIKYLNTLRLTKVHSLLLETDESIDEIAKETGVSSAANLSRTFRNEYGKSPREFRKSRRI